MADEADDEHTDDTAGSDGSGASDTSSEIPFDLTPAIEPIEDDVDGDEGTDAGDEESALTPAIERVADEAEESDDSATLTPAIERVEPYDHLPSAVERIEEEPEGTGMQHTSSVGSVQEPADELDIEEPVEPFEEEPMEVYQEPEAVQAGPETDEEMPLADHIEEMVRRLGVIIVIMALVSGVIFPFGDQLINFLWYSILPGTDVARPRLYHPLALILSRLKVATLGGFVIALPVFVYEAYLFMRPGLYPRERRYFLASVPTSLVLASFGVVFAWRLVLPALFTYFLRYSERATVIAFGLTQTFDLMLVIMGFFAVIFQIPLFIMLAIMMGVTSREWLESRRIYFWGGFVGVALIFSPDPTGMVPFIVAATMLVLFEGTLLLLRWTGR